MEQENVAKIQGRVTLRTVAERVGLTPGTISAVLNNSRAAERIPQHTKDRVLAAARELNYEPNPLARALRTGQVMAANGDATYSGRSGNALVILATDHFARALSALQKAGLRVPDDVSVVDLTHMPRAWGHDNVMPAPGYPG